MLDLPKSDPAQTPKLLNIERVSEGWINKYLLTYELPNGSEYQYESVSRKDLDEYRHALERNAGGDRGPDQADAVCIVPVLPNDDLVLIREFRYAVNGWIIAFPAGLIEPGESLRDCVDRELMEETGCKVRTDMGSRALVSLPQSGYSSVGMGEENVRVVIAHVEEAEEAKPTPTEFIQVFTMAREDVAEFLDTNHDLIGTRCQLLLEAVRRTNALRKRIALALNPITKEDFA